MAVFTSKRKHFKPELAKRPAQSPLVRRRSHQLEPIPHRLAAYRCRHSSSQVTQLRRCQAFSLHIRH